MADYGLLTGLASGISGGVKNYMDITGSLQQRKQQQALLQADLMSKGLQQNSDTGEIQPTELGKQQQELTGLTTQRQLHSLDPSSAESKSAQDVAIGALQQYPQYRGLLPQIKSMSAADLNAEGGLIGKIVGGELGAKGQQARAAGYGGMVDVKKDQFTRQAIKDVVDDKQLAGHIQRIQGAQRIQNQLDDVKSGKMVDTAQFLGDLNSEYVNLLTGSNSPALGKLERTEYTTSAAKLANIIQQIKAEPKGINSPKILQQLETGVDSLKGSYNKAVDARTKLLTRKYKDPDVNAAINEKIDEIKSQYGTASTPQGLIQGQNQPQQGLIQPGQTQQPSKPKTVIQNGHTYTLNPSTGNYE